MSSPNRLVVCAANPLRSDPMDERNSCVCDMVEDEDNVELEWIIEDGEGTLDREKKVKQCLQV